MLSALVECGFLGRVDVRFADLHPGATEEQRAVLAALMHSARAGNLCFFPGQPEVLPPEPYTTPWRDLVIRGAERLPESPYLVQDGPDLYIARHHSEETALLTALQRLQGKAPLPPAYPELTSEQREAFHLVRSHLLSIVTGRPGTGKTFLISALARSLGERARVILTAPTGKAVARLRERNPHAVCQTVHALLGIHGGRIPQPLPFLAADLIVVDEASMLDVTLMRVLLQSVTPGQRMVFVGDAHQLPPVESGLVFGDLVDLLPTAHLRTSLRTQQRPILEMADSALEGRVSWDLEPLNTEEVVRLAEGESHVVLTPLRQGRWGSLELNRQIHGIGAQHKYPIMVTSNHAPSGLFNGDLATVIRGKAYFEGGREYHLAELPSYELAHALSIHKSQGSEFDHVLIVVPPGSERFGREALYTAITRARHSVRIMGDRETLHTMVQRTASRRSGLRRRWGGLPTPWTGELQTALT